MARLSWSEGGSYALRAEVQVTASLELAGVSLGSTALGGGQRR